MRQRMAWFLAGALMIGLVGSVGARADLLGDLGRLAGVGSTKVPVASVGNLDQVLRQSGTIDRALNQAAGRLAVRDGDTKIVPIVALGSGLAVGLAQVAGPASAVERVQAVAEVQVGLLGRALQARVLIPVDTRNLGGTVSRIGQVGVAATINLRL